MYSEKDGGAADPEDLLTDGSMMDVPFGLSPESEVVVVASLEPQFSPA